MTPLTDEPSVGRCECGVGSSTKSWREKKVLVHEAAPKNRGEVAGGSDTREKIMLEEEEGCFE